MFPKELISSFFTLNLILTLSLFYRYSTSAQRLVLDSLNIIWTSISYVVKKFLAVLSLFVGSVNRSRPWLEVPFTTRVSWRNCHIDTTSTCHLHCVRLSLVIGQVGSLTVKCHCHSSKNRSTDTQPSVNWLCLSKSSFLDRCYFEIGVNKLMFSVSGRG